MSEPVIKLPRNADELLRDFPITQPDFDAQAQGIEARLKGSPGGVVFDDLLRTPELAAEPGEPALPSSTRAASAPKSNFAEMARKSVQKKDDDGAALAKELMAAAAQSRRPNAEMVERVRAAGRAPATVTPLPTSDAAAERTSGVVARAEAAPAASVAQPATTNRGTIIGIIGAAMAVAACVALFMKSGDASSPTSAALQAEKAADAPAAATPASAAPAAAAKLNDGVLSPEALAQAPAAAPPTRDEAKGAAAKVASGGALAPTPGSKAGSPPTVAAKQEAVVLEDDPEPPKAVAAEHKVDPPPEPAMKPAEGNSGSVPLNPSAGAVSTALSAVRSSAAACLAGQTDPVTAVVTFAADGHVLRVGASGPSGACIQAALSKAHIAPFAKETFSASTTVRPP